MFVTNWISTTKIQKISEITNFFRHYFLSRTEVKNRKWKKWLDAFFHFLFYFCTFANDEEQLSLPTPYKLLDEFRD